MIFICDKCNKRRFGLGCYHNTRHVCQKCFKILRNKFIASGGKLSQGRLKDKTKIRNTPLQTRREHNSIIQLLKRDVVEI